MARKLTRKYKKIDEVKLHKLMTSIFIRSGVVFFGSYAFNLYSEYMPKYIKKIKTRALDFDVISENPLKTAQYLKYELASLDIKNITYKKHKEVGEIIPTHYELKLGDETIAFIYESKACYSYNMIYSKEESSNIKIASIDTILYFYLSFLFSSRDYYDKARLVCLSQFLFTLQQKNRLKQRGLLKRFATECYGEQETLESIRTHKSDMYDKLKLNKKKSKEYEEWFLKYSPYKEEEKVKKNADKKTRKK